MNDETYINHQYDALIKNATPAGLFTLAKRLKVFAESKLATVHIEVGTRTSLRVGLSILFTGTIKLEAGKRIQDALSGLEIEGLSKAKSTTKAFQQEPAEEKEICPGTWAVPGHVYVIYLEIIE